MNDIEHPDINRIERIDIDNEEWRWIEGFEGMYQISDYGRVKSVQRTLLNKLGHKRKVKGCIKVGFFHEAGYPLTVLKVLGRSKIIRNHRAVAHAFIPNPKQLPEVNHKNGDKGDNRVSNLEWCTRIENARHASDVLGHFGKITNKPRGVNYNKKMKQWVATITFERKSYHLGYYIEKKRCL